MTKIYFYLTPQFSVGQMALLKWCLREGGCFSLATPSFRVFCFQSQGVGRQKEESICAELPCTGNDTALLLTFLLARTSLYGPTQTMRQHEKCRGAKRYLVTDNHFCHTINGELLGNRCFPYCWEESESF